MTNPLMQKLLNMKKLLMIAGMMLAAATAPVWAAEQAQPATDGKNPPATIAWGEAVDGVQAGLVPLGGMKGDGWAGDRCQKCTHARLITRKEASLAVARRACAICGAPKPWSATFIERTPMRMELHFRNLAKEARSVYDARYGGNWRFTFTPVGGGKVWKTSWSREEERTVEGVTRSTINLAVGQQNAVEMGLERHSLGLLNLDGGQPANPSLPPGKYTVTASYAHPGISAVGGNPDACAGHEQGKPCTYWRGTVTTGPVEIEIKPDDAAARFLDAAKYAGFAAVAVVKKLPQGGDKTKPAQLGIEWWDRLYAPAPTQCRIYAYDRGKWGPSRFRDDTLTLRDGQSVADLQAGDRILVTVGLDAVLAHAARNAEAGDKVEPVPESAQWVPWSQNRQEALEAVLAPGWREGCCPWCHRGARHDYPCCACRDGCGSKGCTQNRRNRGECMTCERKVGPATPGVTFRLWAFDPKAERDLTPRNEGRIQAGANSLPLWIEVQNEQGSTPEFQTPGGGAHFDCCKTLFYLVEGPGLSGPAPAFHVDAGALRRMEAPFALRQGSACGQVQLVPGDLFGKPIVSTPMGEGTKIVQPVAGKLFATPGTYTVRAVAGRLVSKPVRVIVEPETEAQRKARQEAEAKAQIERKQQINRERELKQRAIREEGP